MRTAWQFNIFKKKEKDSIEAWLWRLNQNESIPSEINSYHIGIIETTRAGHELYLTGSKTYGKEDEWYCSVDFTPKEKYFALEKQFRKRYSDNEWQEVLSKVTDLIKAFTLSEKYKEHFLSKAEAITLGFDDGDIIRIF